MSFAVPLFLLAITAGLIPVVLHMISRQQAPVLPFSTLRFLRHSVQRTRRRKRIHDLLLLLLRIAALVLVALALARPTIRHLGGLLGHHAARAVVIILDNSASMATVDGTGSRWERALNAVEQLMHELTPRDTAGFLVTCGPPAPEGNRLYENHEAIYQAINACQVRYEQADLESRLRTARGLLDGAEAPNQEIYIVTDMQAVSWNVTDGPGNDSKDGFANPEETIRQAGSRATASDQPNAIPLVVVDVHGPPLPNVALGEMDIETTAPIAGVPVTARVTLLGDRQVDQSKHVELLLDGQKQSVSPTLAVGAGEAKTFAFQFTPDRPGVLRGEFRLLGDDACALDNHRYFGLVVNPHIPVAVVQDADRKIAYLKDAYYLERALGPLDQPGWAIQTTSLRPDQLLSESLARFAVIFCVNLPALDSDTIRKLHHYVIGGGHVIWTCGTNVDPEQYRAMNEHVSGQMLPAQFTEVQSAPADATEPPHIGWLDGQHPALAPLIEPVSLYRSVLVHQWMGMVLDEGTPIRLLARLDAGAPLFVERAVGRGSVFCWATSVHVDWTNLPLRPLFLPLISRLVFHLAESDAQTTACIAGKPFLIPITEDSESAIEVIHPSRSGGRPSSFRFTAAADPQGDGGIVGPARGTGDVRAVGEPGPRTPGESETASGRVFRYPETHDVGVYEIKIENGNRTRHMAFAANLETTELDRSILDPKQLATRLGFENIVFCSQPEELTSYLQRLREGESLWQFFLLAVLIALVAEAYIANRVSGERIPS